jgi:hypothetical protein
MSRVILWLLSGPAVRAGRLLVCLHGVGNWSPTRCGEDVCVSGSCRVSWPTTQLETGTVHENERLVVRAGDLSCEVESTPARWKLDVRGRDLSCEAETARRGSL